MNFSKALIATALASLLLATPQAMASNKIDPALKEKVTAQMTAEGYDVRKVKMENGLIEVYAVKDGKTLEVYLDDKLQVVKTNSGDAN
jgi:hypothetical protein